MRGSARIARAIETRCRCPPESFTPRSPTIVSYFFSNFSANSSTRAIRHASRISSSLAPGRAKSDILANRAVEQESVLQHHAKLRTVSIQPHRGKIDSNPPESVPSVGSWNAAIRLMMVDFPDPDGPTSAVTVPGSERKLTS